MRVVGSVARVIAVRNVEAPEPPGMAISKAAVEALVVSVYVETRTTVDAPPAGR